MTPTAPRHKWLALVSLALAVSLIVVDGTIVNVALPTVIDDLHLGFADAQWVGTLYALIFAALLLASGRLGDRVGRNTTLITGTVLFVAASILAGLAGGPAAFLAARAIQGLGAALVLPSTLSTVNATFFGKDRTIAFAVWGATISAMAAVGPLLGGWLTTAVNWRWVFWINLPLGALIVIGALAFVPQTRGDAEPGFDVAGLLLSIVGLGGLVFGLVQGPTYGWLTPKRELGLGPVTWGTSLPLAVSPVAIAVGLLALAGFVAIELSRARRGRPVLLDLGLFRFPSFRWGNIAAMIIALGEFGLLFVLPLYLQNVLGMSAIRSGLVLVAMALGAMVAGGAARHLSDALTPARTAQIGVGLEAVGVLGLGLMITPATSTWVLVAWLAIYGFGLGLCSAQLTSVVLHDVPPAKSGQGSATQSTVRQLGSALGVAIMSSLLGQLLETKSATALDGTGLSAARAAQLEQLLRDTAGGILGPLRDGQLGLPPALSSDVYHRLATAFAQATGTTMLAAGAALALALVVTFRLPSVRTAAASAGAPRRKANAGARSDARSAG